MNKRTAPKLLKRRNSLLLLFVFYHSSFITPASAQSPYALKTGRELTWLGIGVASVGASAALNASVEPLTKAEITSLIRADINAFDRGATHKFSTAAGPLSDVTLVGNISLLGLVTFAAKPVRQDVKTVGVMYLETLLIASGVEGTVKALTQRSRPFVYNPDVAIDEKLSRYARQSFFSGHATNAFATAVFTGEVFRHYFPHSRLKPFIWVGGLGLATATSVLRYEAGKHYPTDLLAGAAFGSLVGWGIPKLHEVKNKSEMGRRLDVQPWSNGSANGIYMRLAVFSR